MKKIRTPLALFIGVVVSFVSYLLLLLLTTTTGPFMASTIIGITIGMVTFQTVFIALGEIDE